MSNASPLGSGRSGPPSGFLSAALAGPVRASSHHAAYNNGMVIGLLTLDLHFPGARSLKDKRQALRSLETKIRNRFNVSVAEVEHQDLWQRARLAVVAVNTDHGHLDSTLQSIAGEAENAREIMVADSHVEILT